MVTTLKTGIFSLPFFQFSAHRAGSRSTSRHFPPKIKKISSPANGKKIKSVFCHRADSHSPHRHFPPKIREKRIYPLKIKYHQPKIKKKCQNDTFSAYFKRKTLPFFPYRPITTDDIKPSVTSADRGKKVYSKLIVLHRIALFSAHRAIPQMRDSTFRRVYLLKKNKYQPKIRKKSDTIAFQRTKYAENYCFGLVINFTRGAD